MAGQVSLLTLEAIDELCKNTTLWTYSYGISSGKKGVNLLTGDGISKSDDSLDGALCRPIVNSAVIMRHSFGTQETSRSWHRPSITVRLALN